MKIGFIGCGNMAQAMIGGIVSSEFVSPSYVFVSNPMMEQLETVRNTYGVAVTRDNKAVAEWADFLILAVKPNMIQSILMEIRGFIEPQRTTLISIAAGVSLGQLMDLLNKLDVKVIRAMPNTPALAGEGMTALVGNQNVTGEVLDQAAALFRSFGKTILLDESLFHGVTAVSGSSPALIYVLIEAMADAAVKQGILREDAYLLAAQSVLGSAKMVLETNLHPGTLKDRVCSPGGTTIEMVETLEQTGFRSSVMAAVSAAAEKSKLMSKQK